MFSHVTAPNFIFDKTYFIIHSIVLQLLLSIIINSPKMVFLDVFVHVFWYVLMTKVTIAAVMFGSTCVGVV